MARQIRSTAAIKVTKQLRDNLSAVTLFLQEWFRKPQQIGAIAPSSKSLANAMACWLSSDAGAVVLELGPGTGAITQVLLKRGLNGERLVAIEKSPKLADLLRKRFPAVRVITGDAGELDQLLEKHGHGARSVGTVISSLPLRHFKPEAAELVARKVHAALRPGGCWVQYSYHLGNGRPPGASHFRLLCSSVVWWNLPPARVSVYQKPVDAG
jgi:phosphatidylethanolamine/phosphatidyl-N-methylethanolamine N-methyltransferase